MRTSVIINDVGQLRVCLCARVHCCKVLTLM